MRETFGAQKTYHPRALVRALVLPSANRPFLFVYYRKAKKCGRHFTKYEEKETDVAIAARLLEILVENRCDTAVIVSGDTDLASAYRTASRLVSDKTVTFAFPYNRANSELKQLSDASFKVGPQQYLNHQFDDPHVLADGTEVDKPSSW